MQYLNFSFRILAWALFAMLPAPVMAQVLFLEDFQTAIDATGNPYVRCSGGGGPGTYLFPSGWPLRNVDNRTPDAQVSYVNEAWEVREDFGLDITDCVAFSTSYYAPVGAANDWMWTPLIAIPAGTTKLSWNARSYDPLYLDGYEVRIMTSPQGPPTGGTGTIGNQLTNSTQVFSIAAEQSTWISRTVDLGAYAGQSIYIGFRNNSNDKFLLVIDDIKVEKFSPFDPALVSIAETSPTRQFAKIPAFLALGFNLGAQVRNLGTQALSNVVVDADLLVDGAPVAALTSPALPSIVPGATQSLTVGGSTYSQPGNWSVEAVVRATEGDDVVANSALSQPLTVVTADQLTRAEGAAVSTLGISEGNGGELGSDFTLTVATELQAVRVGFDNVDAIPPGVPPGPDGDGVGDFNGYTLQARVHAWNTVDNKPGVTIASADIQIAVNAAIGPMTLNFEPNSLILPPGRYLLSIVEPTVPNPRTLTVQTHLQRYAPGTNWVNWPTSPLGGWANLEQFGTQFERALSITAVLGPPPDALFKNSFE